MLDLAIHIIETKAGHFHPDKFEDHYERALRELIRRKLRAIEKPKATTRPGDQSHGGVTAACRTRARIEAAREATRPRAAAHGRKGRATHVHKAT